MTRLLARYAESVLLAGPLYRAGREPGPHPRRAGDLRARQRRRPGLAVGAVHQRRRRGASSKRHAEADRRRRAALLRASSATTRPRSLSPSTTARENARALRPLISTEMWVQLNMLLQPPRWRSGPRDVAEEQLSRLCDWIKEGCDAHTGITAGTFYRDEAWYFYQLGAAIECADQTTRLLDAKFLSFVAQARQRRPARPSTPATGRRCCARPPATRRSAAATRAA